MALTTGAGAAGTVTIANGIYTGSDLAKAINTQIADSNTLQGNVAATFEATSGKMAVASTDSSSLTIGAGNLTTALNLSTATATDTTTTLLTNLEDASKNNLGIAVGDTITINGDIDGSAVAAKNFTVAENSTITDLAANIASAFNLDTSAVSIDATTGAIKIEGQDGTANALSNVKLTDTDASGNAKALFNNNFSNMTETQAAKDTHTDSSLTFQIGANQGQTMKVDINKMDTEALSLASIDVSTQQGAENAISVIDNAVNSVSTERAKLGAYEHRLEHTINNLGTSSQNLTSAQSQITDVDTAAEMTEFTKDNILSQAAQAMLAQANQQPQGGAAIIEVIFPGIGKGRLLQPPFFK